MNSEELFRILLGLEDPWVIKGIKFDHQERRVDIFIDFPRGSRFPCPVCGTPYGVYDTEERTWRHLNGILEAIKSGINSAVVEGLNNMIRTAFKRSYGFKAQKYRDTIIYLVAGGLKLPPEC